MAITACLSPPHPYSIQRPTNTSISYVKKKDNVEIVASNEQAK
jgi:hypothetical protein